MEPKASYKCHKVKYQGKKVNFFQFILLVCVICEQNELEEKIFGLTNEIQK